MTSLVSAPPGTYPVHDDAHVDVGALTIFTRGTAVDTVVDRLISVPHGRIG
ncbi:hypothetical protein [Nocardia sp. SSK8]|uniref:hypothetical protein n=1 Tax=Nocardia sp. SSK8 TaxID=3120154 RepID=UPI0030096A05